MLFLEILENAVCFWIPLLFAIKSLDKSIDNHPLNAQSFRHVINSLIYMMLAETIKKYVVEFPYVFYTIDLIKIVIIWNHTTLTLFNAMLGFTPFTFYNFESPDLNRFLANFLPRGIQLPIDVTPLHYWLIKLGDPKFATDTAIPGRRSNYTRSGWGNGWWNRGGNRTSTGWFPRSSNYFSSLWPFRAARNTRYIDPIGQETTIISPSDRRTGRRARSRRGSTGSMVETVDKMGNPIIVREVDYPIGTSAATAAAMAPQEFDKFSNPTSRYIDDINGNFQGNSSSPPLRALSPEQLHLNSLLRASRRNYRNRNKVMINDDVSSILPSQSVQVSGISHSNSMGYKNSVIDDVFVDNESLYKAPRSRLTAGKIYNEYFNPNPVNNGIHREGRRKRDKMKPVIVVKNRDNVM